MNIQHTYKERQILSGLTKLLPKITINVSKAGDEEGVNVSHFYIPPENKYLLNSDYYYNDNLKFIHFTSLIALEGIIMNRNLRLYNLHNLNDPREYAYAAKSVAFNNDEKYKKDARDNLFLLSMCKTDLITSSIKNEFNMWRLYGDQGKGVALELSFENNIQKEWVDYYLSTVKYGVTSKINLKELNKLLDELKKELPSISIDLGQLVCFHKSRLFGLEKEIRLLFDKREHRVPGARSYQDKAGETISPIIKIDISKSSFIDKEVKYLELPIYQNKSVPVLSVNNTAVPLPKIERIILGYQYNNNFRKVADHLETICFRQLGYKPEIIKSRLTRYYQDSV